MLSIAKLRKTMSLRRWWRNPTLCPYCFKRFRLTKAPLRPLDRDSAPRENDEKLASFLGLTEKELPKLVNPPTGFFSSLLLDNRVLAEHDRVCPECHLPLPVPLAKGEIDSRMIAFVGGMSSGKSNYFASLIHRLRENIDGTLGRVGAYFCEEDSFDPDLGERVSSQRLWEGRMGKYILGQNLDGQHRYAVPRTDSRLVNKSLSTPLIYRLRISEKAGPQRHWLARNWLQPRFRSLILVFYDTAGEDLENEHNMWLWYRYLLEADAMMFLIDPLQLPRFRRAEARNDTDPFSPFGSAPAHIRPSNANSVFDNMIKLFERHDLGLEEYFAKPMAFVLPKSDALRPHLDEDSRLLFSCAHESGVDMDELERASFEVKSYLRSWGGGHIVENISSRCSDHIFSAVSALGCEPVQIKDQLLQPIEHYDPIRVVDPLFWLLCRLGYLRNSNTR